MIHQRGASSGSFRGATRFKWVIEPASVVFSATGASTKITAMTNGWPKYACDQGAALTNGTRDTATGRMIKHHLRKDGRSDSIDYFHPPLLLTWKATHNRLSRGTAVEEPNHRDRCQPFGLALTDRWIEERGQVYVDLRSSSSRLEARSWLKAGLRILSITERPVSYPRQRNDSNFTDLKNIRQFLVRRFVNFDDEAARTEVRSSNRPGSSINVDSFERRSRSRSCQQEAVHATRQQYREIMSFLAACP